MKKTIIFFLFFLMVNFAFAQKTITDGYGRPIILHGLNTSSSAKHSQDHQPWITEQDVINENKIYGFNTVRYLVFWGAIEPEKDKYNEAYLQEVKKRIEWYTNQKIYVIIDMHQDVFGYGVGGNGAPVWASTYSKTKNLIPDKWAWWLQNLEPTVIKSYVNFFKPTTDNELQQHYIAAWQKIIELVKENPYVIGYDLMNEPHGGNLANTLFGKFEKKQLSFFYEKLITAIREKDSVRYLFIEPRSFGVNFGMKSHLPMIKDALPTQNKMVYAPHCYLTFVDVGGDYTKKHQKGLKKWFAKRKIETAKQQMPMLIGEFGLSPTKKGYDKYLQDIFRKANDNFASWTYWSNDLGGWSPLSDKREPTPIMKELVQPYPKATAGKLISIVYDPQTNYFNLKFLAQNFTEKPTEIFIPKMVYENGYEIAIKGTENYTATMDEETQTLQLFTPDEYQLIEVIITKK